MKIPAVSQRPALIHVWTIWEIHKYCPTASYAEIHKKQLYTDASICKQHLKYNISL